MVAEKEMFGGGCRVCFCGVSRGKGQREKAFGVKVQVSPPLSPYLCGEIDEDILLEINQDTIATKVSIRYAKALHPKKIAYQRDENSNK